MEKRNNIWFGLITGILLPVLSFVLLYQIFSIMEKLGWVSDKGFSTNFRERTLAVVAIAVNLPLLNLFRRRRWDLAMRGVVIATTALAFGWVIFYGLKLV
ncbi:MAG TPA: hypothetical protein PLO67_07735 [Saprospiraceae bacterium]|nr:hypothetical protein [Saprospiraceae bacterium]HPI05760.1 hypothetical protein [Saprospiraceae bacterium]